MTDQAPPPTAPTPAPRRFPGEDDLCEQCGYPIKGLDAAGDCPECGSAIDASHPRHRTQSGGYIKMFLEVARRPKQTFRGLRLGASSNRARMFLLINAILAATLFSIFLVGPLSLAQQISQFIVDPEGIDIRLVASVIFGWPSVLVAVPILSYIEVLGVTWFSRKRGWRVPLRHAERVACYASVGWLPGAVVLGFTMYLVRTNVLQGLWQDLWRAISGNVMSTASASYGPDAAWGSVFLAAVAAMLGFETLVWVGVRQVKFANTPQPDATLPSASENAASSPSA